MVNFNQYTIGVEDFYDEEVNKRNLPEYMKLLDLGGEHERLYVKPPDNRGISSNPHEVPRTEVLHHHKNGVVEYHIYGRYLGTSKAVDVLYDVATGTGPDEWFPCDKHGQILTEKETTMEYKKLNYAIAVDSESKLREFSTEDEMMDKIEEILEKDSKAKIKLLRVYSKIEPKKKDLTKLMVDVEVQ